MSASTLPDDPAVEAFKQNLLGIESTETTERTETEEVFWPRFRRKLNFLERQQHEKSKKMVSTPPQQSHTESLKGSTRRSYVPPSRANTSSVIVHLEQELKKAVDKAVEETGLTQKEFLTAAIQRAVDGQPTQADALTAKMTEEALEKSRQLETILRRVNQNLVGRSR